MAQVVFRSKYKEYRIHFDPKRFGQMDSPEGDDYVTDANGNVATVPVDDPTHPGQVTYVPMRRKITKPAAIFLDSMLVLDDSKPMQRTMIEDLRKIISGKVTDNQGRKWHTPDELWEEDQHTTDVINQLSGAGSILVTLPETFAEEDLSVLRELEKYFHNPIPKPALANVTATFEKALDRFKVRGLTSPVPERAMKQLRPRIIDLVYALQDAADQLKMAIPFQLEPQLRQPNANPAPDNAPGAVQ